MHGSSSVPQELQDVINKYGGKIKQTYGVPVEEIQRGIKHGVRKINVDTDNRMAITGAIRKVLTEQPEEFDPRDYMKPARDAMKEVVKARMIQFGQAGHAKDYAPIPLRRWLGGTRNSQLLFRPSSQRSDARGRMLSCVSGLWHLLRLILRAPACKSCKYICKLLPVPGIHYVGNRVSVEGIQERVQGLLQHALQTAHSGDGTGVGLLVEAFRHSQIGLGFPHDVTQANCLRFARQCYATGASSMYPYITTAGESVDDAHQVIFRDSVRATDLPGASHTAWVRAQIDQDAKGIIGV